MPSPPLPPSWHLGHLSSAAVSTPRVLWPPFWHSAVGPGPPVSGEWTVTKAIMSRTARVLMEGWVRILVMLFDGTKVV